ncbi:MAG: hypothetical protein Q8R45_12640 [Brevundimonas sp.]|nr:hypothetical protein [Brevundimonas sp.]MDP3657795.1 hypothetical protein [Brevundimonas sp.]
MGHNLPADAGDIPWRFDDRTQDVIKPSLIHYAVVVSEGDVLTFTTCHSKISGEGRAAVLGASNVLDVQARELRNHRIERLGTRVIDHNHLASDASPGERAEEVPCLPGSSIAGHDN